MVSMKNTTNKKPAKMCVIYRRQLLWQIWNEKSHLLKLALGFFGKLGRFSEL